MTKARLAALAATVLLTTMSGCAWIESLFKPKDQTVRRTDVPSGPTATPPKPGGAVMIDPKLRPKTHMALEPALSQNKKPPAGSTAKAPTTSIGPGTQLTPAGKTFTTPGTAAQPGPRDTGAFSEQPIPPSAVQDAKIEAFTKQGHIATFDARVVGKDLNLFYLRTRQTTGQKVVEREVQLVKDGWFYDLEQGRWLKDSANSHFQWSAQKGIVPVAGSRFRVLMDFNAITGAQVATSQWHEGSPIVEVPDNSEFLIAFRTDEGRLGKMTLRYGVGTSLLVTRMVVWEKDGKKVKFQASRTIVVGPQQPLDLDTGKIGDGSGAGGSPEFMFIDDKEPLTHLKKGGHAFRIGGPGCRFAIYKLFQ